MKRHRLLPFLLLPLFFSACANTPSRSNQGYAGTWVMRGGVVGELFDVVLKPDGQVVSNLWEFGNGPKGIRGTWEHRDGGALIEFSDGWKERILPDGANYIKHAYKPGESPHFKPANSSPTKRVTGTGAEYVGVWAIPRVTGRGIEYLAIRSDGAAARSNISKPGTWRVANGGAELRWPDASRERLYYSQKGSYRIEAMNPGKLKAGVAASELPAFRQ